MENLLPSPLLLNTLGGITAILLVVLLIRQLTAFVKQVKVNGGAITLPTPNFEHSHAFANHCEKADKTLLTTKEILLRHDNLDRHFEELISLAHTQNDLLRQLVNLRNKALRSQGEK